MALLEMDQAIFEGIKRAGYSHVVCSALTENESLAIDSDMEGSLLKFIPVKAMQDSSSHGATFTIDIHDAEIQVNKIYTNEMSVRFFIEGRYAC